MLKGCLGGGRGAQNGHRPPPEGDREPMGVIGWLEGHLGGGGGCKMATDPPKGDGGLPGVMGLLEGRLGGGPKMATQG